MSIEEFILALLVLLAVAWFFFWFGHYTGVRRGVLLQRARNLRRRRPYTISIDYEFAAAAFKSSGYKVVPAQERLH